MTVVEILAAMVISSLIITALYTLFRVHHLMALRQEQTTLMQQELLAATSQITAELRMCGYSPTGNPGFGFAHRPGAGNPDYGRATDATGVYCSLDAHGDGQLDESGVGSASDHVGYRLNVFNSGSRKPIPDNILRKYDTGAVRWQPAYANIGQIRFRYFDAEGAAIINPGADTERIRTVEVEITAVPEAGREWLGTGNRTMRSRVRCRNLAR